MLAESGRALSEAHFVEAAYDQARNCNVSQKHPVERTTTSHYRRRMPDLVESDYA